MVEYFLVFSLSYVANMVSPYAAWEPFRDLIPENERKCFLEAYHKRLNSDDMEVQVRFTFSTILTSLGFILTSIFISFSTLPPEHGPNGK